MSSMATRIIERINSAFTVCLSVPKIIGTGPIMMTPPAFTLPFPPAPFNASSKVAMKTSANPAIISVNPMLHKSWSLKAVHCFMRLCASRFK
jgi:hypothetical protein